MKQLSNWSSNLLWFKFLALLTVLSRNRVGLQSLRAQADGWLGSSWGIVAAWAAAFAFENVAEALMSGHDWGRRLPTR